MALRTIAADLARLFDAAAGPAYALDDKGRIIFVNEACAAWAGYTVGELLGHESRYHTSGEVTGPDSVAAALAPPPEVWTGLPTTAMATLAPVGGAAVARRVHFIPLGADALDVAGVIAIASPTAIDVGSVEQCDGEAGGEDLSARELHERLARWRRKLGARHHSDRLLGDSPAMRQVRSRVEVAAASVVTVAIVGPVGSGRQHVARAIHYGHAASSAGSLVPLACPLLTVNLLESTVRSLARAASANPTARPATVLLCDADQLSPDAQEQIARSLPRDRAFRVVATAREPLETLAAQGEFRLDLARLLSTVEIRLPPLAERPQDLPLLAQMFIEEENRRSAKQIAGATPETIDRLLSYSWPSNVAELEEVLTEAHRRSEGPQLAPGDLPAKIHVALDAAARPRKVEQTIKLEAFLARIEEELIRRALARAKGNKTKAARLLGMTRPRLYRRLVQLGLEEQ